MGAAWHQAREEEEEEEEDSFCAIRSLSVARGRGRVPLALCSILH